MKLIIFVLIAVIAIAEAQRFSREDLQLWKNFKAKYQKTFTSAVGELKRIQNFLKNKRLIDAHNKAFNKGEVTYKVGVNEYSDLDKEEFLARFTGLKGDEDLDNLPKVNIASRQVPPASWDWRQIGGIPAVRSQGQCGSCWAFGTMAALEHAAWRKNQTLYDLSEQQLVDCVQDSNCDGGYSLSPFTYLAKSGGAVLEQDYKYTASDGVCQDATKQKVVSVKLNTWGQGAFGFQNDDVAIKNAIMNFGVLSVCVNADGWQYYQSGIFTANVTSFSTNHVVALIGWGEENGIPYWIIKNSWNTWWGEKGYIRLDARRRTDKPEIVRSGINLRTALYPNV